MQAAYFVRPGVLELRDGPEPRLEASDDVIVEVEVAGLCGTDLHIVSVPQLHPAGEGIILGHEFVGRVVAVGGAVERLRPGDRVIAGPNVACGQCDACRRGRRSLCAFNTTLGITRDGGFAELARVPLQCLYPIPPGLAPELAVFAEPLSCVMNGLQRVAGQRRERAVVLGAGPIGLYFLRLLRHSGTLERFATEPIASRREAARVSGATDILDPSNGDVVAEVLEKTAGGVDLVVDTTGHQLAEATRMVRPGGTVLVIGMDATCTAGVRVFDMVRQEKTITGCFVNNDLIPVALDIIPSLSLHELITHRFALAEIHQALAALRDGSSLKALVDLRRRPT